ncbi:MAG: carboxypeptidase-like regulatory domain-containing protein [Candidatus Paceibacteria bacterium]
MRCNNSQQHKGLSIVEVIVVTGIVAVFFTSLLSSFYFTVSLIQDSRARQSALSVASNQIEHIRSLSYNAVGTVAGIPAGAIPQVATTTLNDIPFTVRTLIEYVDDPADGIGSEDVNGITTDYKTAKVTVSWEWRGQPRELSLFSRVIPRSIETDVGGGTIRVNVFDSEVKPLPGALVRLVNNNLSPVIDVARTTNAEGIALFGGAPAGAGYEVSVSGAGYSTDGTNPITAELINPSTPPATVAEADITTLNFFIDLVSTLTVRTVSSSSYEDWTESFATTTGIVSATSVVVDGGALSLDGSNGAYTSSGNVQLQPIVPTSISSWGVISATGDTPATTSRTLQVYTGSMPPTLIPDTDLPGNATGFSADTINISNLDVTVYPAISLRIMLATSDTTLSPSIDEIEVSYLESLTPLSNVPLSIRGGKTIGTRADGTPVYKFTHLESTNGAGEMILENVEWDTYTIVPSGYTITESCVDHPVTIAPGSAVEARLTLIPVVQNALRVVVTDSVGNIASGAEVRLSRTGYSEIKETSPCGQTSFAPLTAGIDYVLSVRVNGVEVWTQSEIVIEGNETVVIQLL